MSGRESCKILSTRDNREEQQGVNTTGWYTRMDKARTNTQARQGIAVDVTPAAQHGNGRVAVESCAPGYKIHSTPAAPRPSTPAAPGGGAR